MIKNLVDADAIILGAPGRQGGICGEMRMFLDTLTALQEEGKLQGKVGSAFTSVGGHLRGHGGHEIILQSFHATFLQHGMIIVGNPPDDLMDVAHCATTLGAVTQAKDPNPLVPTQSKPLLEHEVKLAFNMGKWTARVSKVLHDFEADEH